MWLVLLSILSVLVYAWIQRRKKHLLMFRELGVPGPEPNLLLGNAWEYHLKGHVKVFKEWHDKYGPVVGIFMGHKPMMLVADVDLLKNVYIRDFTDFTDRDQIHGATIHNKSLLSAEGASWKLMRRIITPSFTSSKLKALAPPMHAVVEEFTNNLNENLGREIDVKVLLQALTMDVVTRNALGVKYNLQKDPENNELFKLIRDFMGSHVHFTQWIALGLNASQWLKDAVRYINYRRGDGSLKSLFTSVMEECASIVKARRSHRSASAHNDLLQLLMDASASANDNVKDSELTAGDEADNVGTKETASPSALKLSDDQIVQNAFAVLIAGFETTASTLSFFLNVLIHKPEIQEKLRGEIFRSFRDPSEFHDFDKLQKLRYLDAAVKETLRMFPPVGAFVIRTASSDKVYGKWRIPKGMHVIASINSVHRDPKYWTEPDSFEPSRFLQGEPSEPSAWLPFGLGPRNCIGMRFAQLEMKMIIAELLWNFRVEKSPTSPDFPPEIEAVSVLSRMKESLRCRVVRCGRQ